MTADGKGTAASVDPLQHISEAGKMLAIERHQPGCDETERLFRKLLSRGTAQHHRGSCDQYKCPGLVLAGSTIIYGWCLESLDRNALWTTQQFKHQSNLGNEHRRIPNYRRGGLVERLLELDENCNLLHVRRVQLSTTRLQRRDACWPPEKQSQLQAMGPVRESCEC